MGKFMKKGRGYDDKGAKDKAFYERSKRFKQYQALLKREGLLEGGQSVSTKTVGSALPADEAAAQRQKHKKYKGKRDFAREEADAESKAQGGARQGKYELFKAPLQLPAFARVMEAEGEEGEEGRRSGTSAAPAAAGGAGKTRGRGFGGKQRPAGAVAPAAGGAVSTSLLGRKRAREEDAADDDDEVEEAEKGGSDDGDDDDDDESPAAAAGPRSKGGERNSAGERGGPGGKAPGGGGKKPRLSLKDLYQQVKQEKHQARMQGDADRKQRERERVTSEKRRRREHDRMQQRTATGQPVMRNMLMTMLGKLQRDKAAQDAAAARSGD